MSLWRGIPSFSSSDNPQTAFGGKSIETRATHSVYVGGGRERGERNEGRGKREKFKKQDEQENLIHNIARWESYSPKSRYENNSLKKNFFFWCGPFFKSLLNLLQYCFCFMFRFFGHEACGILAPRPGIKPTPPALEGEVLTTGPPGKSSMRIILERNHLR